MFVIFDISLFIQLWLGILVRNRLNFFNVLALDAVIALREVYKLALLFNGFLPTFFLAGDSFCLEVADLLISGELPILNGLLVVRLIAGIMELL